MYIYSPPCARATRFLALAPVEREPDVHAVTLSMPLDYSSWDTLQDSDEERERELERRIAARKKREEPHWDSIGEALRGGRPYAEPKAKATPKRATAVAPRQRPLVTVVPPPWATEGEDESEAAAAAAAAAAWPQASLHKGRQLAIRDGRPARLFARAFSTHLLTVIWLIEALNYGVHVIFRPEPWNAVSVASGYALWAVQLVSLARCQLTDPGSVSDEWEAQAKAGVVPSTACKRSGRLLPPRARYVRRAGRVIVGFDHYCFWLGTPIGFRNRKFFILFVLYSALFCAMGSLHSWCAHTPSHP